MIKRAHAFIWVVWVNAYCWGSRSSIFHGGDDISSDSFMVLKAQLSITTLFQLSRRSFFFSPGCECSWRAFINSHRNYGLTLKKFICFNLPTWVHMSYLSIVLGGSYSGDPSMSYWIFIGTSGCVCVCVHVGTHGSTLCFLFKHNLLFVFSKEKNNKLHLLFFTSKCTSGMFSFSLLTVYNVLWQ